MRISPTVKAFVVFILVIILISTFRSIIDQISFIKALDKIFSLVVSEVWKLFSIPSIFIATLIFCVIWFFRDSIKSIFPKINEISAAGVTAKFSFEENIRSNTSLSEREKLKESANDMQIGEAIYERLVASAGGKAVKFLLNIDKKKFNSNDLVNEFRKAEIGQNTIKNSNDDMKTGFYYGIAQVFVIMVLPFLASTNISKDNASISFTLKPWLRKKIKKSTNAKK